MSTLWLLLMAIGGAVYVGFVVTAILGIVTLEADDDEPLPSLNRNLTVVIAARNEEDNIAKTISSLLSQTRNGEWLDIKIVVVDDRSSDGTAAIVNRFASENRNIEYIRQETVPDNWSPKKAALLKGISVAYDGIILLTDADCLHPPEWAATLADAIPEDGGMAIGQARFISSHNAPLWQRLQAIDFTAQGILSAGLVENGSPYNCSGASMAFDKASFEQVKGWEGVENLISGDDELLLRKFSREGLSVKAVGQPEGVVTTEPPATFREMLHQRARWGSKTLDYPLRQKLVLSGIFIYYVALTLSPLMLLTGSLAVPVLGFLLKSGADYLLISKGASIFGDKIRISDFLMAELLHPPMIIGLAIAGAFGSFEWKGTRYHKKGKA